MSNRKQRRRRSDTVSKPHPFRAKHVESAQQPEAAQLLRHLKQNWHGLPASDIVQHLQRLLDLGCTRRGIAGHIGKAEGTIRHALAPKPKRRPLAHSHGVAGHPGRLSLEQQQLLHETMMGEIVHIMLTNEYTSTAHVEQLFEEALRKHDGLQCVPRLATGEPQYTFAGDTDCLESDAIAEQVAAVLDRYPHCGHRDVLRAAADELRRHNPIPAAGDVLARMRDLNLNGPRS